MLETYLSNDANEQARKKLSYYSMKILEKRYLLKNKKGAVIETPEDMFWRVSKAVAHADLIYDRNADSRKTENEFYMIMSNLEFLPNSPTLMNAGTKVGQLAACFVLPVKDSVHGIFGSLKNAALIHKSGAGTGFSFSNLRPRGDLIESTKGYSSGPLPFLGIFDLATEVMQDGGMRRGANMAVLAVDHPDIYEFTTSKSREGLLKNFNLSVSVTDKFMNALLNDKTYFLRHPHSQKVVEEVDAKDIFNLISKMAWQNGEPGIIFIDKINAANPTPSIGLIQSTNPCGEQPLLPFESCILGSINLAKIITNHNINWKRLEEIVKIAVHFLDNAIDVSKYSLKKIERMTKSNRKIGLGIMGFADLLIKLEIPYNSAKGIATAERIMKFISKVARQKSVEIAKERGSFPNFERSVFPSKGYTELRNATVTTIAPTGSISLIAGCSSGIEPIFALIICRKIMGRKVNVGLHPLFRKIAEKNSLNIKQVAEEVAKKGSIQGLSTVPGRVRRIFVAAHDIVPQWHVRMQAAFQKYTDNAVSKTVNLPSSATIADVKNVFLLAYQLGCKGITVYRDMSRNEQVLHNKHSIQVNNETFSSECSYSNCHSESGC